MIRKGFTLVEILIVVIILGILAAVVIPQFTEASNDARASAMSSDLQTVRSQIELYKIQHLDAMPGSVVGVTLTQALTEKTDLAGSMGGDDAFGPYLQTFPTNGFNNLDTVGRLTDGSVGWVYDVTDGSIQPGDIGHVVP